MWFVLISCLKISEKEYQSKMATFSATEETGINDTGEIPSFYLAENGVTILCPRPEADVGDSAEINGIVYTKQNISGLHDLIEAEDWAGLETSCTSDIPNMQELFKESSFDGDISSWDVSSVENMEAMFYGALLDDEDLSSWDVSTVRNMQQMFAFTENFNGDIGSWDVSSVQNMSSMFYYAASFNQDLSGWCVSQFSSQPSNFDTSATNWTEPRPVWGTCP